MLPATPETQKGLRALRPGSGVQVEVRFVEGGSPLQGHVKDATGGPIQGAVVLGGGAPALTNSEGEFRASLRGGRVNELQVTAEGYVPFDGWVEPPVQDLTIFLAPESVLSGKVVLEGEPVAGATATLGSQEQITGPRGEFQFRGVAIGEHQVSARDETRYGITDPVQIGVGERKENITVELQTVAGRRIPVRYEAGGECEFPELEVLTGSPAFRLHGDQAGLISVFGLPPGDHVTSIECAAGAYRHTVRLRTKLLPEEIVLQQERTLQGRVVDELGAPLPYAAVNVSESGASTRRLYTDTDGAFFGAAVEDAIRLSVSHPDYQDVELSVKPPRDDIVVELGLGGEITGSVLSKMTGKPVPGVNVFATEISSFNARKTVSDATGSYSLKGLAPGDWQVHAKWASGFPTAEDLAETGTNITQLDDDRQKLRLDLAIDTEPTDIAGVVLDEDGHPVDLAQVSTFATQRSGGVTFTDREGKFAIRGIIEERCRIRAAASDGREVVEYAEAGRPVKLVLGQTERVCGLVSDTKGRPVKQFVMEGFGAARVHFVTTDGRWCLASVRAGVREFTAVSNEGVGSSNVTVTSDSPDVSIVVKPQ